MSWVYPSRCSDHFPIVHELDLDYPSLGTPFNFISAWLKEEEFVKLVK
jgi:hypothetical protein